MIRRTVVALALLVFLAPLAAHGQAVLFTPTTQTLQTAVLVAQPDGFVVVSPSPGVVLSVQPNGAVETRSASAIAGWELATRVGPNLVRFDGAGPARYLVVFAAGGATPVGPTDPPDVVVNPAHVPAGPLTADRAHAVVLATVDEFPALSRVYATDQAATDAAVELLLRQIWHLHLAGFDVARQRNPSGRISDDKLCLRLGGAWQAFDIASLGYANHAMTVQWQPIGGADPIADAGRAD